MCQSSFLNVRPLGGHLFALRAPPIGTQSCQQVSRLGQGGNFGVGQELVDLHPIMVTNAILRQMTSASHPLIVSHDWLVGHPVTVMLTLFAVGTLVSIYGASIRQFLDVWPLRTVRAGIRNINSSRLNTIEYLHENTYRLVLFLAMTILGSIRSVIYWYLLLQFICLVFLHKPTDVPFVGLIIGVGIGTLYNLLDTLNDLLNFKTSSVRLRSAVATSKLLEARSA